MSVFDNLPDLKEKKPAGEMNEGFFWPLDHWYIERVLFALSGGITLFSVFLCFVFLKIIFLLPAMVIGAAQIVFAMTGFSITVKILQAMGIKQNSIQ